MKIRGGIDKSRTTNEMSALNACLFAKHRTGLSVISCHQRLVARFQTVLAGAPVHIVGAQICGRFARFWRERSEIAKRLQNSMREIFREETVFPTATDGWSGAFVVRRCDHLRRPTTGTTRRKHRNVI